GCDALQVVRVDGEEEPRVDQRQHVGGVRLDFPKQLRVAPVRLSHPLQEVRLVPAVMEQHKVTEAADGLQEQLPDAALVLRPVRPEAKLPPAIAVADNEAYQVVEVSVGDALDIQVDVDGGGRQVRLLRHIDRTLPDSQRLEREGVSAGST